MDDHQSHVSELSVIDIHAYILVMHICNSMLIEFKGAMHPNIFI